MTEWLLPALKNLNTELADCRIIVESRTFECHKVILACASDAFKRMMLTNCKESISGDIYLKNVTPETFEIFHHYVYSYNLDKLKKYDNGVLMDLYEFGNQWIVPSITNDCLQLLNDRVENCLVDELIEMFEFAYNLDINSLIEHINMKWKHFKGMLNNPRVLQLGLDVFKNYMKAVENILPEKDRSKMAIKYLENNGYLNAIKLKENTPNNKKHMKKRNKKNKFDVDTGDTKENNNSSNETEVKQCEEVVESILNLVDYTKMSCAEFYEGPGKSTFFTYEFKYENMYKISQKTHTNYNTKYSNY